MVKVIDFGIAKSLNQPLTDAGTTHLLGQMHQHQYACTCVPSNTRSTALSTALIPA